MKFSEALEKVSKAYIPGTVEFYDLTNPNPWQKAHDDLDQLVKIRDPELLVAGINAFSMRLCELIDTYRKIGKPPTTITPADAFYIGNEQRYKQWASRKYKMCVECESQEDLKIVPVKGNEVSVVIVCNNCLNQAKGA